MPLSDSLLSGIVTGASGVFNTLLGSSSNANLNSTNRKWQAEQNTIAYQRQQELTQLSPYLQKSGLVQAGISPAAMNGYTGGTASVSSANNAPSSQSEYVPLDVTSAMNAFLLAKQAASVDATIEKTKAETKSIELQNRATESTQIAWNNASSDSYVLDDQGHKHRPSDKDFDSWSDEYVKTHGDLPEFVKTAGVFSEDAARVPSAMSNFRAQIAQSGMYEAQANLAKEVANLKLGDRNVMSAIYRMDLAQYNQLMSAVAKANSDIDVNATLSKLNDAKTDEARQSIAESVAREALFKTQKGVMENSSVNNLIDQIGGDKSTTQNIITVGKILLSILSSVVPNFSITKVLK